MQTRALTVPKGKEVLTVWASGHTHLLLRDAEGEVRSRSDSDGKHVSFTVTPGRYTLESDGRLRKVTLGRLSTQRAAARHRRDRPPKARRAR